MQYSGSSGGQHAMGVPRRPQDELHLGGGNGRAASYAAYRTDTPPRTGSSEIGAQGGWRSLSAAQPGHHGVFIGDGNPKTVSPIPFHRNDVVARHLLVETALLDSQNYELLPIEEVDALKKEQAQLEARLEATRRKLALESKVRDAAQSLHRLYADKGRPITPQSPKKQRMSFLGERGRSGSGNQANQAGDELTQSQKKIDDLVQILSGLESRRQYIESRLLRHTAAVLQVAHHDEADMKSSGLNLDMGPDFDDSDRTFTNNSFNPRDKSIGYEESIYSNNQMDDLKDLGFSHFEVPSLKVTKRSGPSQVSLPSASNEEVNGLQSRLETLNGQMRSLIKQARSGRSVTDNSMPDASPIYAEGTDAISKLGNETELLDNTFALLEQEVLNLAEERQHTLDESKHQQHNVEGQLENVNIQIYNLLSTSGPDATAYGLQPPPAISGQGAQGQVNYLEETMLTLEHVIQTAVSSGESIKELEDAHSKISEHDTTLRGLWEMTHTDDDEPEPYSLQAFNTRVQHLFDRSAHHEQQVDILRRQIQQQRELNSKSDGEKEQQLSDLQASHADKETELLELRNRHIAVEAESTNSRAEIEKVMGELEQLRLAHQTNVEQKEQVLSELNDHRQRAQTHEAAIAEHEAHIAELEDDARLANAEADARIAQHEQRVSTLTKDIGEAHAARTAAEEKLSTRQVETADLESEVVRLTTELTMAKAELDGAYGSRAERAKDLTSAELDQMRRERDEHAAQLQDLRDQHAAATERSVGLDDELAALRSQHEEGGKSDARTALLEKELGEMTAEYQELTRETVEVEKEREQLEALVDGLRERCETLEAQLGDERVRWLGIKSPSAFNGDAGAGRESTSTAVLRAEFKKMMRETRAEGIRLVRAEQEERRKLETQIRNLRRENVAARTGVVSR